MKKEKNKISIGEAADFLGVSIQTLRRWDASGKLKAWRSVGGHRYYFRKDLEHFRLDLSALGLTWTSSAQPPKLQSKYYCKRQDRFTSRLEKMGEIFLQSDQLSQDIISLLVTVTGEIGDNSFMHNIGNWPDAPGVFFAHNIGKRVIVLADRGQGVKKTLLRVRPNIETDIEALHIAFTEIVSGRAPEKRGNGLKVVRRIVESKPIGLLFRSGIAELKCSIKPDLIKIRVSSNNIRGTYAVITF